MTQATEHKTTDAALRAIFKQMDAHQAQEIRTAYYDAITGLKTLADMLEIADAEQPEHSGPLLTEHFHAIDALNAMAQSRLGSVL